MSFIEKIVDDKKIEVNAQELRLRLENHVKRQKVSLLESLSSLDMSFICEVKKASPSQGKIREITASEYARLYEIAGASAVSVLTEENYFNGSLMDLESVKEEVIVPVLRKDFIIDESQLHESYAYGADAVLLIVRLLGEKTSEFVEKAHSIGLECLVEIHSENEIDYALDSDAEIIGINNRNLDTLEVDLRTFESIGPIIPKKKTVVAESGINTREDVLRMQDCGANAILIGSALIRSIDVVAKLQELKGWK